MTNFTLDYASQTSPLNHYWEMCVGSCHAATALREDYREQLRKASRELGFRFVRFHGLFDEDMSVLKATNALMMREASDSTLILSFTNTDAIFDFLLSIGMKPFVELGFLPDALTTGSCTIFHYKGRTSPPDDYEKWGWFIKVFVEHCVERYGLDEVRQWFFEVWNEPNLGGPGAPMGFWGGSMEEYFKLYQYAAFAIKSVDHLLKVGGPSTSDNSWVPETIDFCTKNSVPLDFITTHNYPTDIVNGFRHGLKRFDLSKLATATDEERKEFMKVMIQGHQQLWSQVPRGVLTDFCKEVRKEAGSYPLYYTEWNSGAGIDSDGPFGASFIIKTCLDNHGYVDGYSYWTFTDIFEEGGMPHTPFHGGFGLLNLHGIPKATYRAFELLHKLGSEIYHNKCADGNIDIYAVRKHESGLVQFMITNHNSLYHEIQEESVTLKLSGMPSFTKATVERVDQDHANALRRWEELGKPDYPTQAVIHDLIANSYTVSESIEASVNAGTAEIALIIPMQGSALVSVYL